MISAEITTVHGLYTLLLIQSAYSNTSSLHTTYGQVIEVLVPAETAGKGQKRSF